jgi:hypothetical protein
MELESELMFDLVNIYNLTGQEILVQNIQSKKLVNINTESLSKGIYTIKLVDISKGRTIVKRFVKQ